MDDSVIELHKFTALLLVLQGLPDKPLKNVCSTGIVPVTIRQRYHGFSLAHFEVFYIAELMKNPYGHSSSITFSLLLFH